MTNKLSESAEHYLETILLLNKNAKVVRVKEISKKTQVSMSSVHTALHLLEDQGLIAHERYGYVELTAKGAAIARKIYASHKALVNFLGVVLCVSRAVAERDACKIEHVISPETLKNMATFAKQYMKGIGCRKKD